MRSTRIAVVVMTALSLLIQPAQGDPGISLEGSFVPGEILVRFEPTATETARRAALRAADGRVVKRLDPIGWAVVRVLPGLEPVALGRLARHPAVARAEPNHVGSISLTPNDRCVTGCVGGAKQWNLGAVNALGGWDVVPGRFYSAAQKAAASRILVAVLDTKIDLTMPDWANADPPTTGAHDADNGGQVAVALGKDIVPQGQQHGGATYHGTFVAGILGAAANNGHDIAGLGYRATLVPVTVVDGNGNTTAAWLAEGILHAADVGARVINLSLGLGENSAAVQDAIIYAASRGAVMVAAAGNAASGAPFYPAWHDEVMAVTAVDEADRPGSCTNFSSRTSVAAPGVGIVSLEPSRVEKLWVAPCGTSTAAPHVSALAALLFAQDPARTPQQVRAIIEGSADEDRFMPGFDEYFGHGRVNFERALRYGVGPVVDNVVASFPRNTGGESIVSASARATAPGGVRGAEYFINQLGAPGTGQPLSPADGSWGGATETLSATIQVPISFPTGVHRLFVRARDDTRWGPASVGVLIVDRKSPQISEFEVAPAGLALLGGEVSISFRATDDYSPTGTYSYTVMRDVLGVRTVVHESEPVVFTMPGRVTTAWEPGVVDAGRYEIRLTVRDEANNPAFATAATFVL